MIKPSTNQASYSLGIRSKVSSASSFYKPHFRAVAMVPVKSALKNKNHLWRIWRLFKLLNCPTSQLLFKGKCKWNHFLWSLGILVLKNFQEQSVWLKDNSDSWWRVSRLAFFQCCWKGRYSATGEDMNTVKNLSHLVEPCFYLGTKWNLGNTLWHGKPRLGTFPAWIIILMLSFYDISTVNFYSVVMKQNWCFRESWLRLESNSLQIGFTTALKFFYFS